MGTAASREGLLDSDSEDADSPVGSEKSFQSTGSGTPASRARSPSPFQDADPSLNLKLGSLSIHSLAEASRLPKVKLFRYATVNNSQGKWVPEQKSIDWQFIREGDDDDEGDEEDEESWQSSSVGQKNFKSWFFKVGKIRARVDDLLQMHFYADQMRADFVAKGIWAIKFSSKVDYQDCVTEYENCK